MVKKWKPATLQQRPTLTIGLCKEYLPCETMCVEGMTFVRVHPWQDAWIRKALRCTQRSLSKLPFWGCIRSAARDKWAAAAVAAELPDPMLELADPMEQLAAPKAKRVHKKNGKVLKMDLKRQTCHLQTAFAVCPRKRWRR